ncbi:hypothetical protein SESBI_12752 [Sesbania bispinosa]|nr:hypothetical protein SESBI_12752 [Sesbania bispinosa]
METILMLIWSNLEEYGYGGKPVKQEARESGTQQQSGYSYGGSQLIYQSQQIQNASANSFYTSSMTSENSTQSKMGIRNCSNLIRQKSSPAGFFSNENVFPAFVSNCVCFIFYLRTSQQYC